MNRILRRLQELYQVLKEKWPSYLGWLAANLGGLLVAYAAVITIYVLHKEFGQYLPGPEEILITGAISVAIAGVSYWNLRDLAGAKLAPLLLIAWPFLLMFVYGVLVAMGSRPPAVSKGGIWVLVIVISSLCVLWSSITWLHEQGIKSEFEKEPLPPPPPSEKMIDTAKAMPKVEGNAQE